MTEVMNDAATMIDTLHSRAHWYRLLAGVFAEEPQAAFLRELRSESCLGSLAELGVNFGDDFLNMPEDELLEELSTEYTMLFVAPGGFPPMESVRLQGGLQQSAVSETRDAYAAEGFVVQSGRFVAFDDHLAVEMQFVAALLQRQAAALESDNAVELQRLEKSIKRFWSKHLGRWVRGYAGLVEEAAAHSFYREMARLLDAFAAAELEIMGLDIPDLDGGHWRAPKPEAVTQPMQCGGAVSS